MADSPHVFQVAEAEGGQLFRLSGVIDENANLAFLARLGGHVRLHVKGVRRINSYGVRTWIEALRTVPESATYEFVECSPPLLDQLITVAGFQGRGRVTSFYVPLVCACGAEKEHLFLTIDYEAGGRRLPKVACQACGKPMEVDDLEERFEVLV
jgi:hypothetical protein